MAIILARANKDRYGSQENAINLSKENIIHINIDERVENFSILYAASFHVRTHVRAAYTQFAASMMICFYVRLSYENLNIRDHFVFLHFILGPI